MMGVAETYVVIEIGESLKIAGELTLYAYDAYLIRRRNTVRPY
jgi:hypothetical protein